MEAKLRHDFINNCLRLEVLNKLIAEAIEKKQTISPEHLHDCEKFLKDHLEFIKELKIHN